MAQSIRELNARIRQEAERIQPVLTATQRIIVGQDKLLRRMLIALLVDGHLLVEGVPGLAKTLAIRTLAATLDADFKRIQFTPDLLPSDLVGTQIYRPNLGDFVPRKGPVFSNIVLADEINRAPAKVQSALLEAMEERQVTLGDETFSLPRPFLVLATQNPIEQEGTYPLPEAQLDRFLMKIVLQYPSRDEEHEIMSRMGTSQPNLPQPVLHPEDLLQIRQSVADVYVDDKINNYILDLIFATREPEEHSMKSLRSLIAYGVSPRATLALVRSARANAFLSGRGYVTPDDVKAIAVDVLQHRLVLSFEAEAEGVRADQIVSKIITKINVP